jgi:hypothetical protein
MSKLGRNDGYSMILLDNIPFDETGMCLDTICTETQLYLDYIRACEPDMSTCSNNRIYLSLRL